MEKQERFEDWQPPVIEHGKLTQWNWMVQHPENLKLGKRVDIGAFTYINAKHGVEIGDDVQIGSHCSIYSLSTIDDKQGKIVIKKGAKIGSHSTIMPDISIGENAIIGAHSFVNQDIPSNVVAYGIPAKVTGIEKQELKSPSIPLAQPHIAEDDIENVTAVLKSGVLSLGPKIREFEQKFAKTIGTKYAVGVNSGTSGLHLCIRALGLKEGDEVITSPFSFIASANCILYERATPVFVDVEEDTFNIDPDKIEAAITPKTKALLVPHIFGQSCDMTKIMKIAKKHHLKVIEDACESINATHHGRKVGTFGDVAVFAFYPNKQMTTGEGGMIVTDNKEIYEYCKSASNQGRSNDLQWLTHDKLGYNYRLDEMSAALGIAQLNKIDFLIKKRQEVASKYIEELSEIEDIILPKIKPENISTWFVFPLRVKEKIRDKLIQKLNEKGIQSKAYFFPCIHLQPFYKEKFGYQKGTFPIAEKLSKETLIIPFYPALTNEQIKEVKEKIKESLAELKG
ncbi:MAG: aminotransferase class I/II-fold pyridoxal phosphate-dependent enzyme [Nanoarchaeota archaeon]